MVDLQAGQFRDFFQQLHSKPPFPWQEALAEQVCSGDWPEVIHLPTASGKTACLDIALFALAVRENGAARRIFFVVDRRVVVDEAYLRMQKVQSKLEHAKGGVLGEVAGRFREMARGGRKGQEDDFAPLLVSEMRGGAFRDESWVKNPLQPTVIASTVDQVGSRLLFRGYGVNENSWSLHAGLIANDALIFLDEAHCSLAFAQTLKRVGRYRGDKWASNPISTPFDIVQMTATPDGDVSPGKVFKLTGKDRKTEVLQRRLQAAKPTRLVDPVKGRKDDSAKIVDALIEQAESLAEAADARRVVIFANRVKTAKDVFRKLEQRTEGTDAEVELLIGSMRPIDRDDLYENKLRLLKSDVKRDKNAALTFVVSTQCLEVGADLDFDVLVSECASIDSLQQRFGRLDRLGEFEHARGAIVIGSWQVDPRQPDPVYGEALSKTWQWLNEVAGEDHLINMGIESRPEEAPTVAEALEISGRVDVRLIGEDAPILLPAHVDMLAQTSPVPKPEPEVELFLHGPRRGIPDVQVVWRSDLEDAESADEAIEILKLCPPSSREAMPVRISVFKKWFGGEKNIADQESDLEAGAEEEKPERGGRSDVLLWDGEKSRRISDPKQIKPGQTLVLRASLEVWDELGYIPKGAAIDVGDRAAFESRRAVSLRLHPDVIKKWPEAPALAQLRGYLYEPDGKRAKVDVAQASIEAWLEAYRAELESDLPEGNRPWPYEFLRKLDELRRRQLDFYPQTFCALRARHGKKKPKGEQVFLDEHLQDVTNAAESAASTLPADLRGALIESAKLHDYGKADIRYQAWLRNGDLVAARYAPRLIAKSGLDVLRKQKTVGLPKGFRHELLSLMFAEKLLGAHIERRDLILHLIGAHHGWCRPFAPVIPDPAAECISFLNVSICKEERIQNAPHRLDSGVADRFWQLTAKYGWWGLAYLEALLRLADWQASDEEVAEVSND